MKNKNKITLISVLSVFFIVIIVIVFADYVLKENKYTVNVSNNYLDTEYNCPPDYDIDNNGLVNQADLDKIMLFASEEKYKDESIYDYNNDGVFNTKDFVIFGYCLEKYVDLSFEIDSEKIVVNDDIKVISRIDSFTVAEFKELINTSHTFNVFDSDGYKVLDSDYIKTGYVFRIENSMGNSVSYKLSVPGDILGTGVLDIANAKEIAKYVVDGDILLDEYKVLAADYNNDEEIKMNDVMLLLNDIENSQE